MDRKVLHTRKKYRRKRSSVIFLTSIVLILVCLGVVAVTFALKPFFTEEKAPVSSGESSHTVSSASSLSSSSSKEKPVSSKQEESSAVSVSSAPSSQESSSEQSTSNGENSGASVENYFSNACFIGDSRTEGLRLYGSAPSAAFYSAEGLAVNTVFTQPAVTIDGKKMSVVDALQKQSFDKIYIMFGINELGWPVDSFVASYGNFVDKVKELQPNAEIYVENIFPVTANKSKQSDIYNNPNIRTFNEKIKAMAQEKGVKYVDLYSMLGDKDGNLPKDSSPDGVHLEREYCDKWVRCLMENGD